MILQFSPVILLLLLCGVVSAGLMVIGYYNRALPIARPFILLMAAETIWLFGSACEMMSIQLSSVLVLNNVEYPAMMIVPVALLFISLIYTGREHYLTRKTIPLFFIVPVLVCVFVFTNPWHSLYYTGFHPEAADGAVVWVYEHGPLFWLMVAYNYLVGAVALLLVVARLFSSHDYYRRETIILAVAACIPFLFNAAYVLHVAPFPDYDLTEVAFFLTGVIIAVGLLRYQLFSAVPVAYSRVFSTLHDGVFVVSRQFRIIDLNPAAGQLIAIPSSEAVGRDLASLIPEAAALQENAAPVEQDFEIQLNRDNGPRYYDVHLIPLDAEGTGSKGFLCIFREVTARKQAELSLITANRKINLLTRITRHDLENKLMVAHGYMTLLRKSPLTPTQTEYLDRQEAAVQAMREQIAFTRQYQQLGVQAPAWQGIEATVRRAKTQVFFNQIRFTLHVGPEEVFADQMLERVFYNLLDNAIRYGGERITEVSVTSQHDGASLVLVVEDNGAGIPDGDRQRLFEQGFGKNTGLGLFLSREILAITGITINETSSPGRGARFEIRVPAGKFRPVQSP